MSDEEQERTLGEADDGRTLAAAVRAGAPGMPWSRARELCTSGRVRLNDDVVTDDARRVSRGDRLSVSPMSPRLRRGRLPRERIVFVDRDVVVVDKPGGVLTVPYDPSDKDTLLQQTQVALKSGPHPQTTPLGVVQRLDKDTTGLIVFARTLAAKRHLQQQLRQRTMHRRYVALVHGVISDGERRIESRLVGNRGDGLRGSHGVFRRDAGKPPADAKLAITTVRRLEVLRGASLVECQLGTGRQHQIRIHLAEAGHPLVGEHVYIRDYQGTRIEAPRPMLHAAELGFLHPRTEEDSHWSVASPRDFTDLLDSLRRR